MATKDPHKRTVYLMEHREFRGIWKYSQLTVKQRRKLLQALCRLYQVPVVPLVSRAIHGQAGAYHPDKNRLEFDPKYGSDVITFAHEVAHYFAHHRHGVRIQDHGCTFLTYYAKVLASLRVMPMAAFVIVATRYGLRLTARTSRAYKGHPTPKLTQVS